MILSFGAEVKFIQGAPTVRKVAFRNTGPNTVYWGFEPGAQDMPLAAGATQPFGEGYIIDGDGRIGVNIYFCGTTTGNTISYTQQF